MTIYRTAVFGVRPESVDKCKEAIREFVAEMKRTEPGTKLYVSLQDDMNPTRFFHFYAFDDSAAEKAHGASAATRKFSEFLKPELNGPVSFGDYTVIAET